MSILTGNDLMLFKKTQVGETITYSTLAYATGCQISMSAGTLETTSKDSGKWTSKKATKLSWTVTSDNLYSTSEFSSLMTTFINRDEIIIAFALCTNSDGGDAGVPNNGWTAGAGYEGTAIITSLTANANDGENATFSITLEGTGELDIKSS